MIHRVDVGPSRPEAGARGTCHCSGCRRELRRIVPTHSPQMFKGSDDMQASIPAEKATRRAGGRAPAARVLAPAIAFVKRAISTKQNLSLALLFSQRERGRPHRL